MVPGRDDIIALFKFLDWVMRLPEELEQAFRRDVEAFEKEKQMPYVTSIERLSREEGRQEGILRVLEARFGLVSDSVAHRVRAVHDFASLDPLTEKAATAASLQEFEQALPVSE